MALYWRDLARLYPRAKVLYCTVLYCTVLYPLDKVVLTVRDPAKWHLSVTSTIKTKMDWMANSWLGLPLRWFASLKGRYANAFYRQEIFFKVKGQILGTDTMIAAKFTCEAATYLGARYPRGIFGAVESGEETAVRFFHEWNDQVQM